MKYASIYDDIDPSDIRGMTPEEQKLFFLTKLNTNINRDMPAEREECLQKVYKQIYGDDWKTYYDKFQYIPAKTGVKKKLNVQFNELVEFSRN